VPKALVEYSDPSPPGAHKSIELIHEGLAVDHVVVSLPQCDSIMRRNTLY
jgi:hypothetical protein